MKVYQLYQSVKSDGVGVQPQALHPSSLAFLPSAYVCVCGGWGLGGAGMMGKHQVVGDSPVHQPVIGLGNGHVQTNGVGLNRVTSNQLLRLYSQHKSQHCLDTKWLKCVYVCVLTKHVIYWVHNFFFLLSNLQPMPSAWPAHVIHGLLTSCVGDCAAIRRKKMAAQAPLTSRDKPTSAVSSKQVTDKI